MSAVNILEREGKVEVKRAEFCKRFQLLRKVAVNAAESEKVIRLEDIAEQQFRRIMSRFEEDLSQLKAIEDLMNSNGRCVAAHLRSHFGDETERNDWTCGRCFGCSGDEVNTSFPDEGDSFEDGDQYFTPHSLKTPMNSKPTSFTARTTSPQFDRRAYHSGGNTSSEEDDDMRKAPARPFRPTTTKTFAESKMAASSSLFDKEGPDHILRRDENVKFGNRRDENGSTMDKLDPESGSRFSDPPPHRFIHVEGVGECPILEGATKGTFYIDGNGSKSSTTAGRPTTDDRTRSSASSTSTVPPKVPSSTYTALNKGRVKTSAYSPATNDDIMSSFSALPPQPPTAASSYHCNPHDESAPSNINQQTSTFPESSPSSHVQFDPSAASDPFKYQPSSTAHTAPATSTSNLPHVIQIAGLGYCPALVGPKGGFYYLNRNGNKTYISRNNLNRIERGIPSSTSNSTHSMPTAFNSNTSGNSGAIPTAFPSSSVDVKGLGSREVHVGPRGGTYYINKNGNKTYISSARR